MAGRWLSVVLLCACQMCLPAYEKEHGAWNCLLVNLVSQTNIYSLDRALSVYIDVFDGGVENLRAVWSVVGEGDSRYESGDDAMLSSSDPVPVDASGFLYHFPPDELQTVSAANRTWGWRRLVVEGRSRQGVLQCRDDVVVKLHDHRESAAPYGFESPYSPYTPRIVHFIHLIISPLPPSKNVCDELLLLSLRSAVNHIRPEKIFLHTNDGIAAKECINVTDRLFVLEAAIPRQVFGNKIDWYQHQTDVIRLHALRKWGGVYLDTDVLVLRTLDMLLSSNMFVIGEQSGGGICNGVIISPLRHPFLQRWLGQYISFEEGTMGLHASYLPMMMVRQGISSDVMVVSPSHMHWPSYHPHAINTVWLGNWFCTKENLVLHMWGSRSSQASRIVLSSRGSREQEAGRTIDGAVAAALSSAHDSEECSHLSHPLSPQPDVDDVLAFWPLTDGDWTLRESSKSKLDGRVYLRQEEGDRVCRPDGDSLSLGLTLDESRLAFLPFAGVFNTNQVRLYRVRSHRLTCFQANHLVVLQDRMLVARHNM
eukprot:757273-Hanusia_phi.AAC.1